MGEVVPDSRWLPLAEREYEVWADEQYPPYLLLVVREEGPPAHFRVLNPQEGGRESFAAPDYLAVRDWLGADDYAPVHGRQKVLEWWEQGGHIPPAA